MDRETQDQQTTPRDLSLAFLDLLRLSPDVDNWTEEHLANNPPRLFRLRQLVALFRAFDIPWDPTGFMEGTFIRPEDARYDSLLVRLTTEMPAGAVLDSRHTRRQLPEFFSILFDYRRRVDHVLSFSSGVVEASGLFLLAHKRAGAQNQIIDGSLDPIDSTLAELISPVGARFTRKQLVRDFGYPDVDVSEIDVDWW